MTITRRIWSRASLILFGLLAGVTLAAEPVVPKRIACVGDSITFGAGIRDRAQNSYPAQLGQMLGSGYDVRNFGVNGATMLKKGNKPYWKQGAYKQALAFEPDIVIIKLGTNDTKPGNWQHKAEFAADTIEMIQSFRDLKRAPTVWLCKPVPAYPERWGISDKTIKEEVLPLVEQAATQTAVNVIDLYAALSGKAELFPDKIHPNAEGAKIMAETIAATITGKPAATKEASRTSESERGTQVTEEVSL